jgi:signal transduction histidine kinase
MTTIYAEEQYAPSPVARAFRHLGVDTQYVLLGFPLGIVTIVLGTVGFFLGLGLTVLWIGIPIMVIALMIARGFATLERARIGPVLGRKVPHPYYKSRRDGGRIRRLLTPLTDAQSWLDLLHAVFRIVPSTVAFGFVIAWWAATLGGLSWALWGWSIPRGPDNQDLPDLLGISTAYSTRIVFYLIVGAFFALTLYPVVRGAALLEALFARALLSGVHELRAQVVEANAAREVANAAREVAQAQKAAAVSAEATALRKLERDIHDGPQQRLVRLAMDLGRAEQQFASDPDAARATLAEALTQTRETLDELRALSRGIAPPILVDRGLQAALTALAGRCTVPVDLDAPPIERLDPAVESTAYFVVAEALTNVAKHSRASEVQVSVQRIATGLLVTVSDDGVGGASLAKGHGLAGLDDRVRAAGGVMAVDSPAGEGTRLTAALPI